jgi:thiamine-monophosphate kinase
MAVRPVAVVASVALPASWSMADAQRLYDGMDEVAAQFDAAIVGGDTTRWAHPLVIDVAITAEPYDGIRPVLRSGAKPGDRLYVTGPLGGSLLQRHLTFTPRVREAHALAADLGDRLHAMIDISDGLSLDLWRICEASGVGAIVDEAEIEHVISEDARRAAAVDDRPPLAHALGDGEDYELLLAVAGDVAEPPVPLHAVGRVVEDGLLIRRADGQIEQLKPKGWVH